MVKVRINMQKRGATYCKSNCNPSIPLTAILNIVNYGCLWIICPIICYYHVNQILLKPDITEITALRASISISLSYMSEILSIIVE